MLSALESIVNVFLTYVFLTQIDNKEDKGNIITGNTYEKKRFSLGGSFIFPSRIIPNRPMRRSNSGIS
jgi:hypothetical protein